MKEDVALFQPRIATVINLRQKLVDGAKVSIPLRGLGVFNLFKTLVFSLIQSTGFQSPCED
jgi:hypothetical protein